MMKQELITKKELHEGWKWVRLKEVTRIFAGSSAPQEKKYFDGGKYPFVRVSDLSPYRRTSNLLKVNDFVNDICVKEKKLVKAEKGTLIFPKSGAAILTENRALLGNDAYIVSHLAAVEPIRDKLDPMWLYYYFNILKMVDYCENPGYPSLKLSVINKIWILVPPLPIQQKIASKLNKQMEQIEMMKKEAEREKEASDDIFLSLLEKFFPKKINSPLPPGWRLVRLREITSLLGDGLHGTPVYSDNGEYYFINGNNLSDGKILIKSDTKKVSLEEYNKYKKILNERTIFVSINGTLGNVAFYNDEKIVLSKSVCYLNLLENIDKYFIKTVLNSKYFLDYCNKNATGSTIKNVSLESMRKFLIPLPALSVQQEIVKKNTKQSNEINIIKEQISQKLSAISQLPSSILNEVFGQYKIPEEV